MRNALAASFAALLLVACGDDRPSSSSSSTSSSYQTYQQANDPATTLVKRCATEAGIPANDPQHKITSEQMRLLTACVDRKK